VRTPGDDPSCTYCSGLLYVVCGRDPLLGACAGQVGYVRRHGLGVAVAGVLEEMSARRWARLEVLLPGVLSRLILRRGCSAA